MLDDKKIKRVILILTLVFGVVFIISTLLSVKNLTNYFSRMNSSDAVIVSASTETNNINNYIYEVEFYDKDNSHVGSFTSSQEFQIDDHVTVYYNNPKELFLTRDDPSIIIVSIISLLLFIGLLFISKKRKVNVEKRNKRILKSKKLVIANIETIIRSDKNNKKYYNVVCSWVDPEDNKKYTFQSEGLDFDPTITLNMMHKNTVSVYLKKTDYNKYYVDVSDIKKNKI